MRQVLSRILLTAPVAAIAGLTIACGGDDADHPTVTAPPESPTSTTAPATTAPQPTPTSAIVSGSQDDPYGYDYDDVPAPTATPTQPSSGQPAATATSPAPAPQSASITVGDVFFNPPAVTIQAGATVTWSWSGSLPHSVVGTFNGQQVQSGTLTGSGSFQFTFASAGTFQYVCGIHGGNMSGVVTVE